MNYLILVKDKKFINQTLCYYGILIQNYESIMVSSDTQLTIPYCIVTEGIICDPNINSKIRNTENIVVIKNDRIVIEKRTTNDSVEVIQDGIILDLYDSSDQQEFNKILNFWENEEKIYIFNTEDIPVVEKTDSIAGLASGNALAKMTIDSGANVVTFFDYKQTALDFQMQLIQSDNRKKLFINNLDILTCGDRPATVEDIDKLDFDELDTLYNNLRSKEVNYLKLDLRSIDDIRLLVASIPKDSTLWISNVFHYVTSINYFTLELYNILDSSCDEKRIKILPYTKIYYES